METINIDLMQPVRKVTEFMRRLKLKQNPAYRSIMLMLGKNPIWTKRDFARMTEAGFQNCSTVYSCVTKIIEAAAGVPWSLFRRPMSKASKKEKIEEHPLLDLIKRPNPQDGGAFFTKNLLGYLLIAGNSYTIKVGPEIGPPREMYTMRPDRMKVLPGTKFEPIRGFRYTVGANYDDYPANQILHLKTFNPLDDWYGLSPIEVASKEVDISTMAREWNMKLLQNDCRPPGAIVTEGNLEEEQRESLEKKLEEKMQGYKNAGRPPVFEAGIKWQTFAITPRDMDWLNSDKLNSRKICAVYNVAPELIGDAENKTYSNYQEARKALYIETVLPLLDYLRDEYNNWLAPAYEERLFLDYDKGDIEALKDEISAVYEREEKAWWRTLNEKRIACGDDSIGPEGDVIFVPANLIPLPDISGNREEE